jgi:hypothetical protein
MQEAEILPNALDPASANMAQRSPSFHRHTP